MGEGFQQVVVFITVSSVAEARRIAEALLKQRKAACINIMPGVDSHYWWQGKLEAAEEVLLMVKTRASLVKELVELVRGIHSYQVPEVIALPIVGGNPDYLQWIDEEAGPSDGQSG